MEAILLSIAVNLAKILVIFGITMFIAGWTTWAERKIIGHMQLRLGVMRTGPHGLLQPLADGVKLLFKESVLPNGCDRGTYELAPILSIVPAIMILAVVPFSDQTITLFGHTFQPIIANLNIGILYIFAWSSLSPYGLIFAGWSSNNKYSLLGALRAAALVISYEIPFGFSIIGILMLVGSLNLVDIVNAQEGGIFSYFIFRQPLAALIFFISIVAETNRSPFDLSEAESELVAGFCTEYAGMRYSMFFLAEYISIFVISSMFTVFFLGGWHGPILPPILWFLIKTYFIVMTYMWLRATLPRIRYDQMMTFCWKVMLPLSILNIFLTALFHGFNN
ncbi:NADH-quinone oxidoreductase subunit NuoH [Thermodesulfobacteriota bacterium]